MPHKVPTLIYKYNPNGFVLIGLYIFCLGIFIFNLLSMSTLQIGIFGALFLAVPLYVRYSDNPKVRMQVWDKRKLIFSSDAIDFGEDHYPVTELETAAVYLDSFDGFEFRTLGEPGVNSSQGRLVERRADGDDNKISFRHGGIIEDFTFYLADYAHFAAFRAVINDWAASGVNVVLKQRFDDEFIVGEMRYFNTASERV
jgi:hypothetical protein